MLTPKEIAVATVALILGGTIFWASSGSNLDPWTGADRELAAIVDPAEVVADTTAPVLAIISPADNAQVFLDQVTIELEATDDSGWIELVVQNLNAQGKARDTYTVADNRVADFVLYPGWNTVLTLARDKAGNVSTDFVLVERADGSRRARCAR